MLATKLRGRGVRSAPLPLNFVVGLSNAKLPNLVEFSLFLEVTVK